MKPSERRYRLPYNDLRALNRMDKMGIHHVDPTVFLCYGFLSLAKTLRAQRVSSRYKLLCRSAVFAPLRGISFLVRVPSFGGMPERRGGSFDFCPPASGFVMSAVFQRSTFHVPHSTTHTLPPGRVRPHSKQKPNPLDCVQSTRW
jgi:hypothetical protein